jgi:hypothetical protein
MMSLTQIHQENPAHPHSRVDLTGEALRIAVYLEFLYGFGAAPGIDLGAPKAYSRVPTAAGIVYRQDFERGVTLANIGDEPVDLVLESPLFDLDNASRRSVHLDAQSAEVLLNAPRVIAPRRAS